jgi:recombination protein RecA
MPTAAALLRVQIESRLAARIPAALTPAPEPLRPTVSFGVPELDALTGGLPVGAVTELCGSAGSGRTALSLAAVAGATQTTHVAAWVDPTNAFDPLSAAAIGVLLDRLLWVRCPTDHPATQVEGMQRSSGFRAPHTERVQHGGGSPHPRSEERGLPEAVNALLTTPAVYRRDRITGTPGAPNRSLAAQPAPAPRHRLSLRIEQAGTDRHPSRRGSYVLQQRELFTPLPTNMAAAPQPRRAQTGKPWALIDQALRVTDLLLLAGGFQVIVLDLADIAPEQVTRIPLATWFRFRAAAEHAQSALLVLTQHPATGSSGGLLLKLESTSQMEVSTCYGGLCLSAQIARQRFAPAPESPSVVSQRKPPRSVFAAEWSAHAHWVRPAEGRQA